MTSLFSKLPRSLFTSSLLNKFLHTKNENNRKPERLWVDKTCLNKYLKTHKKKNNNSNSSNNNNNNNNKQQQTNKQKQQDDTPDIQTSA